MDNSSSDSLSPAAQGTFAQTPLPHVLIHALNQKLSGSFELAVPSGPAGTFIVIEGRPAKARTMVDHYLVRVLASIGVLSDNQVKNLLPRLLSNEELHGRALVRTNVITEEQLTAGLRAQLAEQMKTIVELPPETVWRYYDDVDLLAGWGLESQLRIDPYPFVWASLQRQPPWDQVRATLARAKDSALKLKADADPARFGFDRREQAVVDTMRRKAWRLDTLIIKSGAPSESVELVAYCLMLAKQVEFVAASEAEQLLDPSATESPAMSRSSGMGRSAAASPARPAAFAARAPGAGEVSPSPSPVAVARTAVVRELWDARRDPRADDDAPSPPRAPLVPPRQATPAAPAVAPPVTPSTSQAEAIAEPVPPTWDPARADANPFSERATLTGRSPVSASRPTPVIEDPFADVSLPLSRRLTPSPPVPEAPISHRATTKPAREDAMPPPSVPFGPRREAPTPGAAVAASGEPTVFERTTAAPPPDAGEPGYELLEPASEPPPTPVVNNAGEKAAEDGEVFTRSTVERLNAVTPDQVDAYMASQEALGAAKPTPLAPVPDDPARLHVSAPRPAPLPASPPAPPSSGPSAPPRRLLPAMPRPPTPGAFPPRPTVQSMPAVRIPRPPTPAPFAPIPSGRVYERSALVPPEPPTTPGELDPSPLTPQGETAGRPPLASRKPAIPSTAIREKVEPMAAFTASAGRKTLEIPIDRALLDATLAPASVPVQIVAPSASRPPAPPPAPPTPAPSTQVLTLELDSPWDEGWDTSPPAGQHEAEKK